jgi:hypothetical protein
MDSQPSLLESQPLLTGEEEPSLYPVTSIVPSIGSLPVFRSSSTLTPVICDDRAIATLLELILIRGKVSIHEQARRLGVSPQCIRQYVNGRRSKPSLAWFIRFANTAGAKVTIEFPEG